MEYNVYLVDCGVINYNSHSANYRENMRFKDGNSLINTGLYCFVDFYKAVCCATNYCNMRNGNYAVISVHEKKLEEMEFWCLYCNKQIKDLPEKLFKEQSIKNACYSLYNATYLHYDFIKGKKRFR